MHFRITDDADERDVRELYARLKAYNLKHRELSQKFPSAFSWKTRRAGSSPA